MKSFYLFREFLREWFYRFNREVIKVSWVLFGGIDLGEFFQGVFLGGVF